MAKSAAVGRIVDPQAAEEVAPLGPALDLVHLSRQTLGDHALEMELLVLFDRQVAGFSVRLLAPPAPAGVAARADLVHTLKGSARAVGAFALADAADPYEAALRMGALDDVGLRDRVLAEIERARAAIAELFAAP